MRLSGHGLKGIWARGTFKMPGQSKMMHLISMIRLRLLITRNFCALAK